jgi:mannitol-1-/sugar-/sorbitol-6-phosphatase
VTPAALCDLDGVLVDSGPVIARAWRRFAERTGLDFGLVERTIHGRPARESVTLLAPDGDVDGETALIDEWELADGDGLSALPGALELRELLDDDRFAVVTSCSRALAEFRLGAIGLRLPRVVVTRESVARGKPDPECFLLGARLLGRDPADCIVLEDSHAGLAAGRAAGARTVAVATTFPAETLDADVVASSIADVLHLFG